MKLNSKISDFCAHFFFLIINAGLAARFLGSQKLVLALERLEEVLARVRRRERAVSSHVRHVPTRIKHTTLDTSKVRRVTRTLCRDDVNT